MKTLKERFLRNIRWTEAWCPWIWKGKCDPYGHINVKEGRWKTRGAHRIAYELFNGPIPKGMQVLHDCDTPSCVWPGHLRLGNQSDNIQESYDKGRSIPTKGELDGAHKLTEGEAKTIKYGGESGIAAAARFNVSRAIVSMIRTEKRWSHI